MTGNSKRQGHRNSCSRWSNFDDRDPILQRIGGTIPTVVVTGYFIEDINLDGRVRYTGNSNDRDIILQNIGGSAPTNVRLEGLP